MPAPVATPVAASPAKTVTTTLTPAPTPTQSVATASGGTSAPAPVVVTPTLTDKTITVNGKGTIKVQYSSTMINVLSVTPAANCTYEGGHSGATVQVQFTCGRNESTVRLSLVNGVLTVRSGGD